MKYSWLFALPAVLSLMIIPVAGFCQNDKGEIKFKKHVLTTDFIAEGAAVADIDKDGKMDVLAGSHWFKAPSWSKHDLTTPRKFDTKEYSNSFLHFTMDVDHDGWTDFIRIGFPGEPSTWFKNPGTKKGYWKEYVISESVGNESPSLYDIDGDGSLDILANNSKKKKVVWLSAPKRKSDTAWKEFVISNDSLLGTHQYTHGIGFGDINMDGREDVVFREGWWEAPADRKQSDWKFNRANLGAECAQMYIRDFDGDGDSDVLSSSAHNYGIWWYEQTRDNDTIKWIKHEIAKNFSQTHGLMMADVDGDGDEDFVTGKRYYAHNGHDPGAEEPAVLYWFEYRPAKQPSWVPHQIDDNSGAGLNFVVRDINNDKLIDIVIANKKGVYVFEQVK